MLTTEQLLQRAAEVTSREEAEALATTVPFAVALYHAPPATVDLCAEMFERVGFARRLLDAALYAIEVCLTQNRN